MLVPQEQPSRPHPDHPSIPALLSLHPPDLPKYESIRRHLHANPELSTLETETAAFVAEHLRGLQAFDEIHTGIGGTGVVGVMRNGEGRCVLLRADMDGLPVRERTGLEWASRKRMRDVSGEVKDVMHACGHDTHITSLLAASSRLASMRPHWQGTLIVLFQPAEEHLGGATRMVRDGLYTRIPIPDVLLGQHVVPQRAGTVGFVPGVQLSAADSLLVTLHGHGGHASEPARCIDPVLMAAHATVRLQGVVAREIQPGKDFAVVTVASIRAGDADNIIPDSAALKVNLRTTDAAVRDRVLAAIKRIVRAEAAASNAPQEPDFNVLGSFPVTENDPVLAAELGETFKSVFGDDFRPQDFPRANGSEDFSDLARAVDRPYVFWFWGGTDPEMFDGDEIRQGGWDGEGRKGGEKKKEVPTNHSPFFAPVMEPTLQVGIDAMTAGALTFLRG